MDKLIKLKKLLVTKEDVRAVSCQMSREMSCEMDYAVHVHIFLPTTHSNGPRSDILSLSILIMVLLAIRVY